MVEFSIVLGLRQVIEQPVGSRFFRHPDMAETRRKGMTACWRFCSSICMSTALTFEAVVTRFNLTRVVLQQGAFAARSP